MLLRNQTNKTTPQRALSWSELHEIDKREGNVTRTKQITYLKIRPELPETRRTPPFCIPIIASSIPGGT